MNQLLAIFTLCLMSVLCQAQGISRDAQKEFILEDLWKDKVYHSHADSLYRVNNGVIKKSDIHNFEGLYSCSSAIIQIALHADLSSTYSWADEIVAFGRAFKLDETQTTNNNIIYLTDEKDSQIHYINFFTDEFLKPQIVNKVVLSSENVRSEEIKPRYVYRFFGR